MDSETHLPIFSYILECPLHTAAQLTLKRSRTKHNKNGSGAVKSLERVSQTSRNVRNVPFIVIFSIMFQ
jgi:hypothetical protein